VAKKAERGISIKMSHSLLKKGSVGLIVIVDVYFLKKATVHEIVAGAIELSGASWALLWECDCWEPATGVNNTQRKAALSYQVSAYQLS
jgi:hypothetical protein